ncbi:MAG: LytTR family transcriptional regulator [Saprospiraceae bacterium]|nr:LytTR family transcriptional regulator [Saprospiraceae bacterium]MCF8251103.1 LytTR family transcriptional regulator [Saprospiraceae bacterium]MCF8281005.1 LytTR family transcriptional regulator [Bacteroidales bacterium]MCF8312939.1 LytTR family transcriptional regulator [Saprospiraceae bacterium]MCF8441362.1 LytTR family transcriptional regulator [Saprospiraceae bacterium]
MYNRQFSWLSAYYRAITFACAMVVNDHATTATKYAMNLPSDNTGKTVVFPVRRGYRIVRYADIVRCQAAGNYTTIFLANGQEFSICKRLKDTAAMLPSEVFFRAHQSHLVNLWWVELWVREGLVLSNGAKVPVAKSRRDGLKSRLI